MKKIITLILILASLIVVGCDVTNPVYVASIPTPVPIKIVDNTNTARGLLITSDDEISTQTQTLLEQIAIHGSFNGKISYNFHILGRRAGFTATNVFNDLKSFDAASAAFPVLGGAEALEVLSSNANDTIAGTGAQKIKIVYISNANNMVQSAEISLNGVTPVATGFTANEIQWMEVTQVGSNNVAVGNILLRTVIGTIGLEQIDAGGNKSMSGHFMIPSGYTGYIIEWSSNAVDLSNGSTANAQDVRLRATVNTLDRSLSGVYHFQDTMYMNSGSGMAAPELLPMLKMPELTRIKMSTISSSTNANARVDGDFSLMLIQN